MTARASVTESEPTGAPASRLCPCGASIDHLRADAKTCSDLCRKRLERGFFYVITDEDRAAMRRAAELVPISPRHVLPAVPTPEEVRMHVLLTAERT